MVTGHWRSMDTCPKVDGERVLLWVHDYTIQTDLAMIAMWEAQEDAWLADGEDYPGQHSPWAPYAWMPLPDPPEDTP